MSLRRQPVAPTLPPALLARRRGASARTDAPHQRGFVGELARFVLGVQQLAIDNHIEDAAAAIDELGLDVERLLQLGSQTDRLGPVVSLHAVGDGDVHFNPAIWRALRGLDPASAACPMSIAGAKLAGFAGRRKPVISFNTYGTESDLSPPPEAKSTGQRRPLR